MQPSVCKALHKTWHVFASLSLPTQVEGAVAACIDAEGFGLKERV